MSGLGIGKQIRERKMAEQARLNEGQQPDKELAAQLQQEHSAALAETRQRLGNIFNGAGSTALLESVQTVYIAHESIRSDEVLRRDQIFSLYKPFYQPGMGLGTAAKPYKYTLRPESEQAIFLFVPQENRANPTHLGITEDKIIESALFDAGDSSHSESIYQNSVDAETAVVFEANGIETVAYEWGELSVASTGLLRAINQTIDSLNES